MRHRWTVRKPSGIVNPVKITLEEVRRVAGLAHLRLEADEEEPLRSSLDQILMYVEKLDEIDTSSVTPALGVTEEGASMREDRPGASLSIEESLANAPESGRGHFKVPRVMPG
jgi:aspartyl-tRNA(Asn)/glutamyl-tRNA(Gln) amidotransferase subunit C